MHLGSEFPRIVKELAARQASLLAAPILCLTTLVDLMKS
jgi:hypothetical protein